MFSQARKYILYTNQNLLQGIRALFNTYVVGGNGWKNPEVLPSLLWRGCLVCMLTSQSAQKKGRGRQSRQRTTAELLEHCWHMWASTFSRATAVLTSCGLAALQLSEKIVFLVLQLDEATRGLGVGASISSPVASHKDSWRSCKNPSVQMVKKKNQNTNICLFNSVLYVVAVKGITFFHNFDNKNFKYKGLHTLHIQPKNILTQCFGQLEAT